MTDSEEHRDQLSAKVDAMGKDLARIEQSMQDFQREESVALASAVGLGIVMGAIVWFGEIQSEVAFLIALCSGVFGAFFGSVGFRVYRARVRKTAPHDLARRARS